MALGERRTLPRLAGSRRAPPALVLMCLLSLAVGAKPIPLGDVVDGLLHDDGSEQAAIVRELRVPRTLLGLAVGVALGLAGALMQALTRNPLADPGLLGVNAGAAAAVVVAIGVLGVASPAAYVWFAFAGRRARLDRRLRCSARTGAAGATPGAARAGRHRGRRRADRLHVRRHAARPAGVRRLPLLGGRLARRARPRDPGRRSAPFLLAGAVLALALARPLNALALGDDAGRALGAHLGRTRALGAIVDHPAVRRRDRGRRADRLRRPDGPARRPRDRRPRPALGARVLGRARADPAARRRRDRPRRGRGRPSSRSASSPRSRRARVHRARAPDADRAAVSALACTASHPRDRVSLRVHAALGASSAPRCWSPRSRSRSSAIGTGDYPLSPGDVLATLVGQRRPGERVHRRELRLPRVLAALLVGAALGIAGAVFQSISRNPLGSPDIVGFTRARRPARCSCILLVAAPRCQVGARRGRRRLVTAVAVYLLASATACRATGWCWSASASPPCSSRSTPTCSRAPARDDASPRRTGSSAASTAAAGSTCGRSRPRSPLLVPAALALARRLRMLEMGDDAARALGVGASARGCALIFVGGRADRGRRPRRPARSRSSRSPRRSSRAG